MSRPGDLDWREVKRRLMHGGMKLRPWEIQRLTLAEIVLALDEDTEKPRRPSGSVDLSDPGTREEYAAWVRSLTPTERIQAMRDGRL